LTRFSNNFSTAQNLRDIAPLPHRHDATNYTAAVHKCTVVLALTRNYASLLAVSGSLLSLGLNKD